MLLSSLLAAAVALSQPAPDGAEPADAPLLPLYEETEEDAYALYDAEERLLQLRDQPLNINKVGEEELLSVPGVDVMTANSIMAYRKRYGDFRSVEELDMADGIGDGLLRLLSSVLYVEGDSAGRWYGRRQFLQAVRHARHDITLTASIPTYYRAGDKGSTTEEGRRLNGYAGTYLGDALRHSLRYTMNIGNNLQLSLTGSKAAGEPFFSAGNSIGYDRYSYSIAVRDLGIFQQIILGKYRGQFGMGLVYNNGLSFGKQAMLSALGRRTTYLAPHTSATDARHMQGVAATAHVLGGTLSVLASCRYVDATLNADGSVSTVLTSGSHRTVADMEKKNNTTQTAAGVRYACDGVTGQGVEWGVGASYLYTGFSRPLDPVYSKADTVSAARMYRLYNPAGSSFWNAGVDYRLHYRALTMTGETAVCETGAVATLHSVLLSLVRRVTLTATGRIYPYRYHTLCGSAFGDSRSVSNEKGVMIGMRWAPKRTFSVDIYTDVVSCPWQKYRVASSSSTWDNSLMANLQHGSWTYTMRYRVKSKSQDDGPSHRLRAAAQYEGGRMSWRTNIEGIVTADNTKGCIIGQSVTWRMDRRYSLYGTVAYFNTDDYESHIYSYERGPLYSMNSAAYYGSGVRCALLMQGKVAPWLIAVLKAGTTKYFDRSTIGSGARRIYSSSQTDIDVQLRATF